MAHERIDYTGDGISEEQLAPTPYEQIKEWVDAALARGRAGDDVPEPSSMAVATVDAEGRPNVRTVLLRFLDERGPGFVTALTATKAREIGANPAIAATITWPAMFRAIRFRGRAVEISREEVRAYFEERPHGSQVSAWASRQSEPVGSREELEAAYAAALQRFPEGEEVPVPDFWGGYRIVCDEVELWGGRRSRLHDRLVFTRVGEGDLGDADAWRVHRRQP